jgi:hypothetical protein
MMFLVIKMWIKTLVHMKKSDTLMCHQIQVFSKR